MFFSFFFLLDSLCRARRWDRVKEIHLSSSFFFAARWRERKKRTNEKGLREKESRKHSLFFHSHLFLRRCCYYRSMYACVCVCMAASINSKRFALLHLFILSFFFFFFFSSFLFTSSTRDWVSANYRSSPPTHQQYLDINGKKRKKYNKQAAFFSLLCARCCLANRLFSQLTMTWCKALYSFDTLRDSINACWCMSKIVDSLNEYIFLLITRWEQGQWW